MRILNFLSDYFSAIVIGIIVLFAYFQITKTQKKQKAALKILDKAIKQNLNEPMTLHPEINPSLCMGCGTCTAACPEGTILQLVNHKAVLVAPTKCVGHGECERACPLNAITLVFGTKTRGQDIPRVNTNYETNVPGLYIAGELGGMGLIRNATKQGIFAANHALSNLGQSTKEVLDLFIIGAGPAGFAAAIAAVAKKKTYMCIDQNSFGGTIYNFPRQKVVMSAPAELPIIGTLKFTGNKVSKEELLSRFNEVRTQTGVKINEMVKFEKLEKENNYFKITTSKGEFKAQKVILAMGVRGSPRKLGLPNEDLPKVTYNLLDPQEYQGKHVCVVGGGNAGVEAAQYLAKPELKNKVTLLVRSDKFDRCNEDNQNIINKMSQLGYVKISYNSSVTKIEPTQIVVNINGETKSLANDFLFIFAGAEMPHKFLMSLGVQIDKKFAEGLQKGAA